MLAITEMPSRTSFQVFISSQLKASSSKSLEGDFLDTSSYWVPQKKWRKACTSMINVRLRVIERNLYRVWKWGV